MSRLRIVDSKTMEKVLFSLGFEKARQKGSRAFYRHADGRAATFRIIRAGTWPAR